MARLRSGGRLAFIGGSSLVVLLTVALILPGASAAQPSPRFHAPYLSAISIAKTSFARGCGSGQIPTPAAVNATSGTSVFSAKVTSGVCTGISYHSGRGWASGLAGLRIPFSVGSNGSHVVSVSWSVAWNASTSVNSCFTSSSSASSAVKGELFLYVIDLTNATTISTGHHPGVFVSLASVSGGSKVSAGTRNITLALHATMVSTHLYEIKTYVFVEVSASAAQCHVNCCGVPAGGLVNGHGAAWATSRASLDLAGPGLGATLVSAKVR